MMEFYASMGIVLWILIACGYAGSIGLMLYAWFQRSQGMSSVEWKRTLIKGAAIFIAIAIAHFFVAAALARSPAPNWN
jgi:hypothetical protein